MSEWGSRYRGDEPADETSEAETERPTGNETEGSAGAAAEAPTTEETAIGTDDASTEEPGPDSAEEAEAQQSEEAAVTAPRAAGLPLWFLIVATIAAVLIAYSLLRVAGEQRYQSCVSATSARLGTANDPLSRVVRTKAVAGCSHSPF
jgi:cobalamin biosynthesis Mg chelatase CobN